jgi:serine/threonine protein kinase
MQADMLTQLADIAGVIQIVEQGTLPGGLPYVITRPFGSLLAINDSAELVISVVQSAASIIQQLACRTPPVLHRDISVGNLIYYGDDQSTFLIDFGTAVVASAGCLSAMGPYSITGTCTFIARSVLEGEGYSLSSELESLMYVLVFLAVDGAAHWGNKPIGPAALDVKVATFGEQESFDKYVLRRCRSDLMQAVKRLRNVFWEPTYQRNITTLQFCQAVQPS